MYTKRDAEGTKRYYVLHLFTSTVAVKTSFVYI